MPLIMRAHRSGRYAIRPEAALLLKQARLRSGLKQYQLGEMLGLKHQRSAQAKVHAIESGRAVPSDVGYVMNASTILGVPLTETLTWVNYDDEPPPASDGPSASSDHGSVPHPT